MEANHAYCGFSGAPKQNLEFIQGTESTRQGSKEGICGTGLLMDIRIGYLYMRDLWYLMKATQIFGIRNRTTYVGLYGITIIPHFEIQKNLKRSEPFAIHFCGSVLCFPFVFLTLFD